jgi:hypothetical protein
MNMPNKHRKAITKLAKQLDTLDDNLTELGDTDDLKSLLLLIRKPWWTSPAELAFALGIVESLNAQVKVLAGLKTALMSASRLVAEK